MHQKRYREAVDRVTELEELKREKQSQNLMLESFIRNLASSECALDTFDEQIWMAAIERVVISPTGKMTFEFKDGTEICQ